MAGTVIRAGALAGAGKEAAVRLAARAAAAEGGGGEGGGWGSPTCLHFSCKKDHATFRIADRKRAEEQAKPAPTKRRVKWRCLPPITSRRCGPSCSRWVRLHACRYKPLHESGLQRRLPPLLPPSCQILFRSRRHGLARTQEQQRQRLLLLRAYHQSSSMATRTRVSHDSRRPCPAVPSRHCQVPCHSTPRKLRHRRCRYPRHHRLHHHDHRLLQSHHLHRTPPSAAAAISASASTAARVAAAAKVVAAAVAATEVSAAEPRADGPRRSR